jgi:protease-4
MTLTGSIGVVSARVLAGTLAARIGVRPQVVRSAPHADLHSPFRKLDPEERALAAAEIDEVYAGFVGVVAEGRGRTVEEIEQLAGGRVWSGGDALRAGLVDELGGLPASLRALQSLVPQLRDVAVDQLPLRVVTGGPSSAPIATEPAQAAAVFEAAGAELGELWSLCQGRENALAYALIPKIR